jgi:hypothetical protein
MVKIRASVSVSGENFSPSAFSKISAVKLIDTNEVGDISRRGRNKGQPERYGCATIEISDKAEENWSRFDDLLSVTENCIDALRKAGADEINLDVSLYHDGPCNFSFSCEQIRRIAALKVDLPISCYDERAETIS